MVSATLATADIEQLESAVRRIQQFVRDIRPGRASGDQARHAVALLAEAERAASSGIALLAPVVAETGSYAKEGHGTAADWLAAHSGTSAGAAKGRLTAAQRAAASPQVADALHDADLSAQQIQLLARAETPGELLSMISKGSSHQELSETASRQRAAARCRESERARRDRVHANRHFRWSQVESGGIRGEFFCDEVAWAKVNSRLESEAKRRWKNAGSKCPDDLAAHRLDAFLDLLAGIGAKGAGGGGDPLCVVLVDAEALQRGTTVAGEICEIDGVGPISVDAASELLYDGAAQFMLRQSKQICSVTGRSRYVAQRLAMTLVARDRRCAVPGCPRTDHLEGDHRLVDFAKGGLTELVNLARLCPSHHDMKTYGGWTLQGEPFKWEWIAPPNPPSANAIARARRLAAAQSKINRPRRT